MRSEEPRILLVEDDQNVRDATQILLRVRGYRVTAIASLSEALQEAGKQEGIDLLVTDYHLRDGETGVQVISALRARLGIQLKAVLITGDTSAAIKALPTDPALRIAKKPFKGKELFTVVQELLACGDVSAGKFPDRAVSGTAPAHATGSAARS
jgi:two-component system, sensor histidine kinase